MLRRGDLAPARALYMDLLQQAPQDMQTTLQARLARVDELSGPKEIQALRQAQETTEQAQAEAAANEGRLDEAIAIYARIVSTRPDDQLARERMTELIAEKTRPIRGRQGGPTRALTTGDLSNVESAAAQESGPLGQALHSKDAPPAAAAASPAADWDDLPLDDLADMPEPGAARSAAVDPVAASWGMDPVPPTAAAPVPDALPPAPWAGEASSPLVPVASDTALAQWGVQPLGDPTAPNGPAPATPQAPLLGTVVRDAPPPAPPPAWNPADPQPAGPPAPLWDARPAASAPVSAPEPVGDPPLWDVSVADAAPPPAAPQPPAVDAPLWDVPVADAAPPPAAPQPPAVDAPLWDVPVADVASPPAAPQPPAVDAPLWDVSVADAAAPAPTKGFLLEDPLPADAMGFSAPVETPAWGAELPAVPPPAEPLRGVGLAHDPVGFLAPVETPAWGAALPAVPTEPPAAAALPLSDDDDDLPEVDMMEVDSDELLPLDEEVQAAPAQPPPPAPAATVSQDGWPADPVAMLELMLEHIQAARAHPRG